MKNVISIDSEKLAPEVTNEMTKKWQPMVSECHKLLQNKTGPGNDFLGWMDIDNIISEEELVKLETEVKRLRETTTAMVVIGIGGSYLGARALIEAMSFEEKPSHQVYFAGYQLSAGYHKKLLKELEGKEICLNMISKSGTTLEPAVAFRILKKFVEEKYGAKEAAKRIIATTDKSKGTLRELADKSGYASFVVPNDVGGRYSVLSPVGLLPIAYAGFDVRALIQGAREQAKLLENEKIEENEAYFYAVARNILYNQGKNVEVLSNFEPSLVYLSEWWKQLYGESEGKNGMGLFPCSANFSTDLHSLGQYIQDGRRNLFETFLIVPPKENSDMKIQKEENDPGKLNYLEGKSLEEINHNAYIGTAKAHREGAVPNMTISIPNLTPHSLGHLVYFFEKACALSGYLLGINPFDQPGVECYKKNMFSLLGRP